MFHLRLKQLRKPTKMTQEEVAIKLGTNRTTYSGYERGTSEPDLDMIRKMASLYGVTVGYLINGKEDNYEEGLSEMIELLKSLSKEEKEAYITLWKLKKER